MPELSTDAIIKRAKDLKSFWSERDTRFKEWYKLIQMVDLLAQDDMESFVGNDPRAAYNLTLHTLDQTIPHRIPAEEMRLELFEASNSLENFYRSAWADIYYRYRIRGRQSWLRDFIGLMIATGWYSVFSIVSQDGKRCLAEIWNPATVFQNWDDELVECAHILDLSPGEAWRMAQRNGWPLDRKPTTRQVLYDYWLLDDGGKVHNSIVLGRDIMKPDTQEHFSRIPIFTNPVGGLPDTGFLSEDANVWKGEIGQPYLATNERVYKSWNKWWTFSMQLLRDTAQPRWFEQTRSGKPIIKPENIFKRGAIFRGSPEDSINALATPPIPIDMRSTLLDMEAMMQRGGPPHSMYGAVQQQMTSYVMSQVTAAANQMMRPFHRAVVESITDMDNFWLEDIRGRKVQPYGFKLPSELPEDILVSAEYEIQIPGDLANRATIARMLNPEFTLSEFRIMRDLFPEITNPLEENAKKSAEKALRHPLKEQIDLIESFRTQADVLKKAGDTRLAKLYAKAADMIEAILDAGAGQNGQMAQAEQMALAQGGAAPRPPMGG